MISDSYIINEERQDSGSEYLPNPKAGNQEYKWAHSFPAKSRCLCGSVPHLLPGNLSRDRAANFLRVSVSPDILGKHPDGVRSNSGPGLSREPRAPQCSHHFSSRGLFTPFPAWPLSLCRNTPLEFSFCVSTVLQICLRMLKYFAFLKIQT